MSQVALHIRVRDDIQRELHDLPQGGTCKTNDCGQGEPHGERDGLCPVRREEHLVEGQDYEYAGYEVQGDVIGEEPLCRAMS